jgi:hypothetical protein
VKADFNAGLNGAEADAANELAAGGGGHTWSSSGVCRGFVATGGPRFFVEGPGACAAGVCGLACAFAACAFDFPDCAFGFAG